MYPPGLSAATWRKSSYSGGNNGACVELARVGDVGAVRDSKCPSGAVLVFRQPELAGFLNAIKTGQLTG
ncbi:DUF397 domain-containing protein [Goodfellowiella coeruleoviolacea]|uniref:DUF397 domain-containing protein n=1 Tax=Goodfellowiella coeruleoviolacea TaxID=334858 RepID=A0AAE3GLR1_9PSEU|nr:DUF397 domain-containing protein [Goodfellowiella coeruleoviolacea]MCP2170350.1 protein of unknown function (DUF397) [Goodfellowiella coeruleoviolacea]